MRVSALGLAGLISLTALASASANECYRRVVEPASYRTVQEEVLVSPERQVPEYIPAVTREVEETVMVRPAREVTHVIPAEYGVQEETVLVSPARREWRTRNHYGELIGCWVDVPPVYATQARRVILRPAQYQTEVLPAVTATRARLEVVEPAHTVYHSIAARYATRERVELVAPASARWAPASDHCEHRAGY